MMKRKKSLDISNNNQVLIRKGNNSSKLNKSLLLNNQKYNKKIQNKISSLIIETIKYIQFYIRINYHRDKEIQKLNKSYFDFLVQKKDNIFLDYIYKQKLSIESFYYLDIIKKQSINIIENIRSKIKQNEELFELLIEYKIEFIENNLK